MYSLYWYSNDSGMWFIVLQLCCPQPVPPVVVFPLGTACGSPPNTSAAMKTCSGMCWLQCPCEEKAHGSLCGSLPVRSCARAPRGWVFIPCCCGDMGGRREVSERLSEKGNWLVCWWVLLRSQTKAWRYSWSYLEVTEPIAYPIKPNTSLSF